MWIVKLALSRPYTFAVMAVLIVILGAVSIVSMPTDIFPNIDIPVVSVIWNYNGMSPDDMEKRVVNSFERAITTTVNDVEHIESQSMASYGVIRVYFHPGVRIDLAVAQLTAISNSITRVLPPGIFPPFILRYNAATVPILQLALSSNSMSEQTIYDLANSQIRMGLATVQGASIPIPYGGRVRQIMVDLDPHAMQARRLSAVDISTAVNAQNLVLPSGTAKIGSSEFNVRLNASPELVHELNSIPVKDVNGAAVYLRDVAQVRDGFAIQTNVVRQNGSRGALLTILKNGNSSTLEIIERVQKELDRLQSIIPKEMNVRRMFDQSLFVRASIDGVVHEGIIAAVLTGLMILLFLGSWRSTLIVCVSIPLSILVSISILYLTGQTLNVMTLGGLALAVGILVDDATVEIENIHRNRHMGKPLVRAILDGAQQIAVPTFVSTLSICIVFVPVIFLTGAAKFLFTPLALAVVFAMMASYMLSRTIVPTMSHFLLAHDKESGLIWRMHEGFNVVFEKMKDLYGEALEWSLSNRAVVFTVFFVFVGFSGWLATKVGEDFFPEVDAGQFRLHVRGPVGSRIEETEQLFARVEGVIKQVVPARELDSILDNIGLPSLGINLAYSDGATIGRFDGEILVSLKEQQNATKVYVQQLRRRLQSEFPEAEFFFQPANMINQILNFGRPAPFDIQVVTRNRAAGIKVAREIESKVKRIPGAVDVHLHQVMNYPDIQLNVDRAKADVLGLSQRDVANSLLVSLSSSGQTQPNFWLDPANGVSYQVTAQTPQVKIENLDDIMNTPITPPGGGNTSLLSNIASVNRSTSMAVVNHYNVQPIFNVFANVENSDLGTVQKHVEAILKDMRPKLPKGVTIDLRGQVETMNSSFLRLGLGLLFAILLVYMLMVVNFQSWLDPFIILTALPGSLSGIVWLLFVTQTTFNVPSLMGAIMSIGVGVANSILLVTFANDLRPGGLNSREAALEAGVTRLRPVVMTASAMIIGMLPMSLGLGEGGEQNAPLGRAVIGGLLLATVATLFIVPLVYSGLRKNAPVWNEIEETE
ncbi:efflux RND transporter permease subunit [Bryobacter aggregatus]|uniref:efflux RND transporter permease subunit n=1 Tax=Bryobacter aggregatus TaxID=360054 RepID=UPI0004E270DE|nr:efflux RND transporter permease subunit [Bryobacter aggregatus]